MVPGQDEEGGGAEVKGEVVDGRGRGRVSTLPRVTREASRAWSRVTYTGASPTFVCPIAPTATDLGPLRSNTLTCFANFTS